jgi:vacuolar-type H+-ATPase subunit E/Vma4
MAYTSDTDAFEIKRVMRQEAHEKAFEIKVQTQRLFEKEKNKIVKEGRHRIDKDIDAKEQKTVQDLNIQRSTLVIKQRMDLMTKREELMKGLVKEVL